MLENLVKCLEELSHRIGEQYKNLLESEDINASGKLSNSVTSKVVVNGYVYEACLSLESYWKYIEDGRPATSNGGNGELRRNILEWIRVKPVIPRPYNGKLPTNEQLAYLISRKIHKEGYKGKQPLKRTIDVLKTDILDEIRIALEKDLNTDVLNILKTLES